MRKANGKVPRSLQELGRALRAARVSHRRAKTLTELSREEDVSVPYLSACEAGTNYPSERVLRIYARHFGADLDHLCMLGGRVPSDVAKYLVAQPSALQKIREQMEDRQGDSDHGKKEQAT